MGGEWDDAVAGPSFEKFVQNEKTRPDNTADTSGAVCARLLGTHECCAKSVHRTAPHSTWRKPLGRTTRPPYPPNTGEGMCTAKSRLCSTLWGPLLVQLIRNA